MVKFPLSIENAMNLRILANRMIDFLS